MEVASIDKFPARGRDARLEQHIRNKGEKSVDYGEIKIPNVSVVNLERDFLKNGVQ